MGISISDANNFLRPQSAPLRMNQNQKYISALSTALKIYKFWCHTLYTHYFGCSNNCKIDSQGQGKKTLKWLSKTPLPLISPDLLLIAYVKLSLKYQLFRRKLRRITKLYYDLICQECSVILPLLLGLVIREE